MALPLKDGGSPCSTETTASTATGTVFEPKSPPEDTYRILQSYPLGLLIVLVGLFLHEVNNFTLLGWYCAELGCFEPGCHGRLPNQCLPPLSNTYIVFGHGSVGQYSRRVIMLIVCAIRTVVFPPLSTQSHWLLVNREGVWKREERQRLFTVLAWAQAIVDALHVVFWDIGPVKPIHTVLAIVLIGIWMVIPPLWILALMSAGGARERMAGCGLAFLNLVGSVSAFKLGLLSDSKRWDWYMWEWICITMQGLAIMMVGLAFSERHRFNRCKLANGSVVWKATVDDARSLTELDPVE